MKEKQMLSQLQDRILDSARHDEDCAEWVFSFSGGVTLRVSAPWRLTIGEKISLGFEDHGHSFGLPTPLDAQAKFQAAIIGKKVETADTKPLGDLSLCFSEDVSLDIFNASCGYEGWALFGPGDSVIIAQGGGLIVG